MKMIDKVRRLETDAVILDLEDAVPINHKETARIFVRDSIKLNSGCQKDPYPHLKSKGDLKVYVRINSLSSRLYKEDLDYIVVDGLNGLMLPKSETEEDVIKIEKLLEDKEKKTGLKKGKITIMPLIETSRGVMNSYKIASASKRVIAIGFGAVDFAVDNRIKISKGGVELLFPRSLISIAAHASGVQPIDSPWIDIQDTNGLIKNCETARNLGYTGKMAIHPTQLDHINKAFTPSKSEIEYAKKIVGSFNEALQSGVGAISINGKMIDQANLKQAEEVLKLAELVEKRKATI
jgi:citrate lyase subunit beta/citryl-CoA lyase